MIPTVGKNSKPNAVIILGAAGGAAIGLLVANWSAMRAVVYAVIWLIAAGILLYRQRRETAEKTAERE